MVEQYKRSQEYDVVADPAAGKGQDAWAQVLGNVASTFGKVGEQAAVAGAAQKGAEDAAEGKAGSALPITAAGQAYNQAAGQISRQMFATSMSNAAKQYYQDAMQAPLTSQTLPSFQAKMQGAATGYMQHVPEADHALAKSYLTNLSSTYGTQLTNAISKHQYESSNASLLNNAQSLADLSTNYAGNMLNTPDGFNLYTQTAQARDSAYQTLVNNNSISADAATKLKRQYNAQDIGAGYIGYTQMQIQNAQQNQNDPAAQQQARDSATKVFTDSHFNKDISAAQKEAIGRQTAALVKTWEVGNKSAVNASMRTVNQYTRNLALTGKSDQHLETGIVASLPAAKQQQALQDIAFAHQTNSIMDSFRALSPVEMAQSLAKNQDKKFLPYGIGSTGETGIQNAVLAKMHSIYQERTNDPGAYINDDPSTNSAASSLMSKADGIGVSEGNEVRGALTNPSELLNSQLSPQAKSIVSLYYQHKLSLAQSRNMSNQNSLLSNETAQNLVASLHTLPMTDKIEKLTNLKNNLSAQQYSLMRTQLIKNKLDPKVLGIMTLPQSEQGYAIAGSDSMKDPKSMTVQWTHGVYKTYGNALTAAYQSPSVNTWSQSHNIFLSKDTTNANTRLHGVVEAALQSWMYKRAHGETTEFFDNYFKNSINSQYTIGGMTAVPKTINTGPNNTAVPLPLSAVQDKREQLAGDTDDIDPHPYGMATPVGLMMGRVMGQTILSSHTWATTPNGDGEILLDAHGQPVKSKSTHKTIGFKYAELLDGGQ